MIREHRTPVLAGISEELDMVIAYIHVLIFVVINGISEIRRIDDRSGSGYVH